LGVVTDAAAGQATAATTTVASPIRFIVPPRPP
jgi:hypothetical protein